ncbi:MAG: glycosyltransferase family 4 protein [Flavobacterium sp.]|nr:glycosyltransferase family 4 protein [Flavobacterium sp.]
MKTIFLESHHIKNLYFGFGQFNLHLLRSLRDVNQDEFKFEILAENLNYLKSEFGKSFSYKRYYSFQRYPAFRIRKNYDLWHSLNQNTKIEPHGNVPYLLTVHNTPFVRNPENYMQFEEHQKFQEKLSKSVAITYISNFAKSSTHQWYKVPDVPQYVIYNGNPIKEIVFPENYRPNYVPTKPFLFAIGEITGRKNFITLVEMLANISGYELVIAGKNSTKEAEEIKTRAQSLGIADRVTLVGKVSDIERQYYYNNCKAFVFPSLREGFGLPVIEAMRFGKPVFISDKTSLPEIGGDLANYWEDFDPQYMASVFNRGMAEFETNAELIVPKLIARSNEFTWENAAKQYFEVYRDLLK